jgi:molybdopterin-synthase adenylyltransferase
MHDAFHHETLYRGTDALARLRRARLTVCGAGAFGSNLVDNLTRQGLRWMTVIDDDRIEAHNVGTHTYAESDVGEFKVEVLQAEVFRAVGVEFIPMRMRLTERNVDKLLAETDLVVDGFDDRASRALVTERCRTANIPCLHVRLSAERAEVLWNKDHRVPQNVIEEGADYPLARNLVHFAVALASEAIVRFILTGEQQSYSFTLQDLRIDVEG